MKRSEAIQIIGDYIFTLGENQETCELFANKILNALEKSGMEAPKVKVKYINPIDFPFGVMCTMKCNCEDCNPDYLINKWEKENET